MCRNERVNAPEEGGQGLAGAGGGQDQGVLATLDGRPAFNLRRRRLAEGSAEPIADGWGEGLQHVVHAAIIPQKRPAYKNKCAN